MTNIRCPYCKGTSLHYEGRDEVIFDDEFQGSITRYGVYCQRSGCRGQEGFSVQMDFTIRKMNFYYRDNEGEEIE